MPNSIQANDIVHFKSYQKVLEAVEKDIYAGSPFRDVRTLSSSKKGAFFEKLAKEYLVSLGFTVGKKEDSGHDLVVSLNSGKRLVEVKGSTLWGDGTQFQWGQIRPAQNYDTVCFIAMWPDRVDFFGAAKESVNGYILQQDAEGNWLHNHHGGKKVNSGTFKVSGFPEQFSWMRPLDEVIR